MELRGTTHLCEGTFVQVVVGLGLMFCIKESKVEDLIYHVSISWNLDIC